MPYFKEGTSSCGGIEQNPNPSPLFGKLRPIGSANPLFGWGKKPKYAPGTYVKKAFPSHVGTERMWVKVIKASDKERTLTGTLDSEPFLEDSPYQLGERVTVKYSEVIGKMNTNPGNPQAESERMYEAFHGKPPEGETIVQEEIHEHEHLATLGVLVNYRVATLSGFDSLIGVEEADAAKQDYDETAADRDTVFLAANEDGTQLYFKGGDQSLPLERFKMGESTDWFRDDMIVGILYEVTYRTKKKFDKFQLTDYYHELGEETGDQPMLRYDPHSPHLYVSGGKYKIKVPLIGVSPGIEN